MHVTLRARDALPSFRSPRLYAFVRGSVAAAHKVAFRVVQFSVQTDHVHLVVEGDDHLALVRGVQGLAVRCAKALNRAIGRRGNIWSSRYHARALRTPTETRRGFVYVLLNHRKHLHAAPGVDPRSSGPWFDGWKKATPPERPGTRPRDASPLEPRPVVPAHTWLAAVGWRRAGGAIAPDEEPRPWRAPARAGPTGAPTRSRRSRRRRR